MGSVLRNLGSSTLVGSTIEYRQPYHNGEIVIQVHLNLPTPRFCSYFSSFSEGIQPITLFVDDINAYVIDALRRKVEAEREILNGQE